MVEVVVALQEDADGAGGRAHSAAAVGLRAVSRARACLAPVFRGSARHGAACRAVRLGVPGANGQHRVVRVESDAGAEPLLRSLRASRIPLPALVLEPVAVLGLDDLPQRHATVRILGVLQIPNHDGAGDSVRRGANVSLVHRRFVWSQPVGPRDARPGEESRAVGRPGHRRAEVAQLRLALELRRRGQPEGGGGAARRLRDARGGPRARGPVAVAVAHVRPGRLRGARVAVFPGSAACVREPLAFRAGAGAQRRVVGHGRDGLHERASPIDTAVRRPEGVRAGAALEGR
mmetsp:Transcript_15937/g.55549  ORF Transcript_15937/g.55549 Transcript_15937/m.55549 type:complete len:290 (-) Transcript_15937:226-1095(-)